MSGLGGWGDPNDDFAVVDGGLSGMHVSYPSPHVIRRNFTLRPFDFPIPWFSDTSKMANTSITADGVDRIINNYVGDFKAFQVAWEVRSMDTVTFELICSFRHNVISGPRALTAPCT